MVHIHILVNSSFLKKGRTRIFYQTSYYAESRPKNLNDMYIVNGLDCAAIFKCNFFSYFSADPEGPGCCALVRFSILMK